MEISKQLLDEMNRIYYEVGQKLTEFCYVLFHRIFQVESGWENRKEIEDKEGHCKTVYYPMPFVEVKGYCVIEIFFDRIEITAKKRGVDAMNDTYEKFSAHDFEIYGDGVRLGSYGFGSRDMKDLRENVAKCNAEEVVFSFFFPFETDGKTVFEFVKLLRKNNFYF